MLFNEKEERRSNPLSRGRRWNKTSRISRVLASREEVIRRESLFCKTIRGVVRKNGKERGPQKRSSAAFDIEKQRNKVSATGKRGPALLGSAPGVEGLCSWK